MASHWLSEQWAKIGLSPRSNVLGEIFYVKLALKELLTGEKMLDMRTLKIAVVLLLYFNIAALPSLAKSTTPVVFIPGFAGSYLCEKAGNKARVWPARMDHRKIRLPMNVDLDVNGLAHEACGVVREPIRLGSFRVSDVYGNFVDHLQRQMADGVKVLEFSYDWRLSVEHNARQLRARLDQELPDRTVDIVAHSFGGLGPVLNYTIPKGLVA
jgi:hypothetical protein